MAGGRRWDAYDRFAPDLGKEAGFRTGLGGTGQVTPGVAGAEVNDYDAISSFGGGVGDVGYTGAGGVGQAGIEIEADII